MSLPFSALLLRTLREQTRSRAAYVWRQVIAVLIYFVALGSTLADDGAPGRSLFQFLFSMNVVVITLVAVSYFASALAEEKEQWEQGLLRLTRLNPFTLLLGKAASMLLIAAEMLLVQMPFALMAVPLGGVSLDQILAGYVTLGAYLLLVVTLSLLASVVCRGARAAGAVTATLLLAYLLARTVGNAILRIAESFFEGSISVDATREIRDKLDLLASTTPAARFGVIMELDFGGPILDLGTLGVIGLSAVFFTAAVLSFEFFNLGRRVTGAKEGTAISPRRKSELRAWENALRWKDFHFVAGGVRRVVIKSIAYVSVAGAAVLWALIESASLETTAGLLALFFIAALILEMVSVAGRVLHVEIWSAALPALMSLPISEAAVLRAKIIGCGYGVIPAAVCATLSSSVWIFVVIQSGSLALVAIFITALYAVTLLLFYLYAVLYLSFRMERGAALGALAMVFLFTLAGGVTTSFLYALVAPISNVALAALLRERVLDRMRSWSAA